MRRFVLGLLSVCLAFPAFAVPKTPPPPSTSVLFILDSSGSMWERVDGQPKVVTAKKVLNDLLKDLPPGTHVGLMTYGHRRKGDCGDIEILSDIGKESTASIAKKVNALKPKGETPIAAALLKSKDAFRGVSGTKMVVLITDGAEECHGDPCASVKQLAADGLDVHINVVGFTLKQKEREAVLCIAREGRGKYYDAADTKGLTAAMAEVKAEVVRASEAAAPVTADPSLLSPSLGGQLIAAPNDTWQKAITGNENDMVHFSCSALPTEAVFAFKDEKPATFSKFEILIPHSGQWVKDFELLAADDSPGGSYRSLGKFTTQNLRLIKTPYQPFSFPATTARYLKLRILSAYTGDCSDLLTQIRLVGTSSVKPGSGSPPGSAPSEGINLLAPSEGGQVLVAPELDWQKSISGKDADTVGFSCTRLPAEAVYAFKDERPASFSHFEMLIAASGQWVKDFELQAADDSPLGTYRSLGKFTTQNLRLMKGPYQDFGFPQTTARYLKLRVLSAYTGDCSDALSQIRLMGHVAGNPPPAPAAPKAGETNLLSPSQGGQLIPGSHDGWAKVLSGNEKDTASFSCAKLPAEAVFAFKNKKAATFSTFEILIPHSGQWVKDFELLAADDSPTGTYRSLGKFATQNARLFKTPYQPFRFSPTTARYLKLKVTSAYTGDCDDSLTQIRLLGKPGS